MNEEIDNKEVFKCYKCNGLGHFGGERELHEIQSIGRDMPVIVPGPTKYNYCDTCHGTGKLDWVENARGGKSGPFEIDNSSVGFIDLK